MNLGETAAVQRLFGLSVRSSPPIPYTTALPSDTPAEVMLHCGVMPSWLEASLRTTFYRDEGSHDGRLMIDRFANGAFLFEYPDGTRFVVTPSELWMSWCAPLDFADACTYLVGPVFAFVMRLRGFACLHASAVMIGGRAIGIVGGAGIGKSTLAAALIGEGCTLVAEDVLAVGLHDGRLEVLPSYAGIRLWPESVALLFGMGSTLPAISPTWDKRMLNAADHFAAEPCELAAVYILDWTPAPALFGGIASAEGAMRLIANSYRGELLDGTMRRRELEIFGSMAATLPMRIVPVAHDRAPVTLARLIHEDADALLTSHV